MKSTDKRAAAMGEALPNHPQRYPVFASAALLLPIVALLFLVLQPPPALATAPSGDPQVGIIVLSGRPALILFVSGLLCALVALLRREGPPWIREAGLFLYGILALAGAALLVVRLAT